MAIAASTQFFRAGPVAVPAVPLVLAAIVPSPVIGMFELAETVLVPVAVDEITTVQVRGLAPAV